MNAPNPEIHITLNLDGTTEVEVFGARGPSCAEMSKPYASLFQTEGEVKKSEYHEVSLGSTKQQQRL